MSYTRFAAAFLVVAGVFALSARPAAAFTSLQVCNRGSVPVSMAAAFTQPESVATAFRTTVTIRGWGRLEPGECRNVFRDFLRFGDLSEGFTFYLGLLIRNENGQRGTLLAKPEEKRDSTLTATTQVFCVDPVEPFFRQVPAADLGRGFGLRDETGCSGNYKPMEFSARVYRPDRTNISYTYTIAPGPDSEMRLFDGPAATSASEAGRQPPRTGRSGVEPGPSRPAPAAVPIAVEIRPFSVRMGMYLARTDNPVYRAQITTISESGQQTIQCTYGPQRPDGTGFSTLVFWYQTAPDAIREMVTGARHPLWNLGFEAVSECPPTIEAAAAVP